MGDGKVWREGGVQALLYRLDANSYTFRDAALAADVIRRLLVRVDGLESALADMAQTAGLRAAHIRALTTAPTPPNAVDPPAPTGTREPERTLAERLETLWCRYCNKWSDHDTAHCPTPPTATEARDG